MNPISSTGAAASLGNAARSSRPPPGLPESEASVPAALVPQTSAPAADGPGDSAPAAVPPPPNPNMRLETSLGVVVMEFRNGSDQVQRSVPSEPELQAYRLAQRMGLKLE